MQSLKNTYIVYSPVESLYAGPGQGRMGWGMVSTPEQGTGHSRNHIPLVCSEPVFQPTPKKRPHNRKFNRNDSAILAGFSLEVADLARVSASVGRDSFFPGSREEPESATNSTPFLKRTRLPKSYENLSADQGKPVSKAEIWVR